MVDGALDHEGGALVSREASNVYATREPQEAFHKRIRFCLDVHVEAVRVRWSRFSLRCAGRPAVPR